MHHKLVITRAFRLWDIINLCHNLINKPKYCCFQSTALPTNMIVATSPSIDTATQWAAIDPNPITSKYTSDLIDKALSANDESARSLESMFPSNGERISFGTAGLRSEMKPGPLGMNDLTVCQTAQGLAKYCLKQGQQKGGSEDGVKPSRLCAVVGYDHRSNPSMNISSLSFAILTAIVFAEAGIDCILLDGFVLTPLVPFALQQLGAVCGIMITASHNPKQDNGYKVYASDGCQIRAPMDKEIASEILDNLQPWTDYETIIEERTRNYPNDPCLGLSRPQTTKEMLDEYFITLENSGLKSGQGGIQSSRCSSEHCDGSLEPPSFAYTAMHGIGYPFAKRAFEVFGLRPFHAVPEQREPDPSFPTVPFPNPEEAGALDLGKVFATENGCDIVLANDPDADRLAVAEKDRTTGEWTVFSGDQIGVMLGLWIWETTGMKSDKMLAEIGRREGFHVEETLTGFKWIGSRSVSLETEGYRNLFGYEEAIGFACGSVGFDKDGISAMVVMSELALYVYRERGISLKHQMESLYDKYGYFVSSNGYYFMHDQSTVKIIMNRLRSDGSYDTLKQVVAPYEIESIRDLGNPGYDSLQADNKPTLPTSGKAPMMTIRFANGCIIQLRPSGTEPKFKYYTEMKGRPGIPKDTVEKELTTMVDILLDRLLQPLQNGLIKKA